VVVVADTLVLVVGMGMVVVGTLEVVVAGMGMVVGEALVEVLLERQLLWFCRHHHHRHHHHHRPHLCRHRFSSLHLLPQLPLWRELLIQQ